MASLDEIGQTAAALKEEGARFALTHCTSAYPPRYDQINLRVIPRLREQFDVLVGHSDHTPDLWTALGAVCLGARVIEKHFTLDRGLKGPDYHVSLEPDEFRTMVDAIRKMEAALGDKKTVYPEEQTVRDWAHHSVVACKDIPAGTTLGPETITVKRPGSGIPARHLENLYGRVAAAEIRRDTILQWEHVR
jgi:N-acetylneuraminate synthase